MPKQVELEDMSVLSPLEWHALAYLGRRHAPDCRQELPEGEGHKIDLVLKIQGALNVAPGTTYETVKPPSTVLVLASVFEALGLRARKVMAQELVQLFSAYVFEGTLPSPSPEALTMAEAILGRISRLESRERQGTVSGSLAAEVVRRR